MTRSSAHPKLDQTPPERPDGEAIWQELECGGYVADLPLWRKLVDNALRRLSEPCEALDLGSGNGRVSLAIARDSCHVTALDLDRELVEVAARRAHAAGAPVDAVQGDMRSFELGKRFDLVIAPMQLIQLLRSEQERHSMLDCVARHLEPGGKAAFALLELDEQWATPEEQAPIPDMREVAGWLYSSQPVAVRLIQGGATLELDRVRRVVSPAGDLSESFSRVHLQLLSPHELRGEAAHTGLRQHSVRTVPATEMHMASTVLILERRG